MKEAMSLLSRLLPLIFKIKFRLKKGKRQRVTKLILGPALGLSLLVLSILVGLGLHTPPTALASHPDGLEIAILGASLAGIDQGSFCDSAVNPDSSTPDGIWLPVIVTNTTNGGENYTYTGLEATLTAPSFVTNSDPIRYLGTLAPGESTRFYYFFDYRALRDLVNCADTGPTIDTWFNEPYTITIQSLDGSISGSGSAVFTDTFNSKRLIDANAGGTRISDVLGPGIAVGQVFTQHVVYDFGLTTNEQIIFQPTGNGSFPDECFRLVGSEIIDVGANVTGISVGVEDTLSFSNVSINNSGGASLQDNVTIEYQYLVLCDPGNGDTFTYPWAPQISGNDFKYNAGGFGPSTFPIPQPITGVVDITKSVTPQFLPTGGTVTYTVEFANTFSQPIYLTQISDTLDPGLTYGGMVTGLSDVLPSNSTISPTVGATGTLSWFGIPFPDNNASYLIPGLSSIQLVYTATVTSTAGSYDNVAFGVVGGSVIGPAEATVVVGLPPDLDVEKTSAGPVPLEPGDLITYTIVISNSGGDASGVTVSDTIPLYTSFVTGSVTITPPSAGGIPGSPPIIASDIYLAFSSAVTITYNVIIDDPLPAGVELLTNTVSVTSTDVPTPTTDIVTDTVVAAPDLQITKTDGGISSVPGGVVVYSLTYNNVGNQDATGVVITDTVPANTTFNAGSSLPTVWSCLNGSLPGTVCTVTIGDLAVGQSGVVSFAVTVDDPLPAGVDTITNTTLISDDGTNGPDPTPANNTDTDTTPLTAAPDLQITKTDGGISSVPGGVVVYTLTYSNVGNQDATGVVITDTVPANTSFNATSSLPTVWSCADGSLPGTVCTVTIGDLAVGQSGVVSFAVTVDDPLPAGVDTITNTTVISDDGSNGPDPTPANNTDTDTTPLTAAPDLQITKTDGGNSSVPGGVVVYTLTYSNVGDQDATGVVITDTVPANTTFNASSSLPTVWSCLNGSLPGTVCTVTIGDLAVGQSGVISFAVTVDDPLPVGVTQIFNTAFIGDDQTPNADNDSDDTPLLVPAIAVVKDVEFSPTVPMAIVTYTINITNTGAVTLDPVRLTDTLPAGLSFVPTTGNPTDPTSVSPNGRILFWANLGALTPGQSSQVSFRAQVITNNTGTYINTATATGDHPGGTVSDTDDAPIFVTDPTVDLEKYIVPPGLVGEVITFSITITNTGPSPLGFLPFADFYEGPIEYAGGTPIADDASTPGVLRWTDLVNTFGGAPLQPGDAFVVVTAFSLTTMSQEFSLTNTAVVSQARDIYDNLANRDEDTELMLNVPTAVTLLYFEFDQQAGQTVLNWATAVEIDNFGFRFMRSTTGQLADAVEIAFVPGQGHGTASGASYSFVDPNIDPNQTYTYWLIDVDFSGTETVHGPAVASSSDPTGGRGGLIYLPLIVK